MKGFVCKMCGFIAIDGKAPEVCPVCGAPKSAFKEEDAVKTPADPANLTEPEKKHIPVIIIERKCGLIPGGCTDVHARIGEIQHPMLPEHFIGRVDFYIDRQFTARVKFTPQKLNPAASLHFKDNAGRVTVISSCNIHGAWINEKDI